jgi:polyribonucleotide nucleotidyltransferase
VLDTLDEEVKDHLIQNNFVERKEGQTEEEQKENMNFVGNLVYKRVKATMRKNVLEQDKRLDLRKLDEVRMVSGEISLLPKTHGSALFRRGMTQALSITTLG